MPIQALNTAASGMRAMDTKLSVVANNLANIETVAFKKSRVNFEDLFYRTIQEPGLRNALEQPLPLGQQIGLGVQVSNTQLNFEQGALDGTGHPLDLAIEGDGFFQVQAVIDGAEQTVYTRAGNFTQNANGEIVLGNSIGARLEPQVSIPQDAVEIQVGQNGLIAVRTQGSQEFQDVGQIELARFINPAGLKQLGKNLYQQTDATGPPITGNPTQDGLGTILQANLELSNVDPVRELVELIKTQRAFELNSQSIQSADQTLQTINNLRRF
ncbi:MAG TPA: flagellar basal-body rod protein FlgG [Phycisphaerae bacterium]|nr:flagellar basal-body rod protein FlgG [Phycisphaerae bacterium]